MLHGYGANIHEYRQEPLFVLVSTSFSQLYGFIFKPFHKCRAIHVPKPKPITGATETSVCTPRCTLCMRFHSVIVVVDVDVRYDCQSGRQAGIGVLSSVTILPPPHFVWLMRTNKLVFFHLILNFNTVSTLNSILKLRSQRAQRTEKTLGADQIIIINNHINSISNFLPLSVFF